MSTSRTRASRPKSSSSCPRAISTTPARLHRRGTMRLATAADEILPLRDPRVQQNEAYLAVIVLARVITRLGSLPDVTPASSRVSSPPTSRTCSGSTSDSTPPTTTTRRPGAGAAPSRSGEDAAEDGRRGGSMKAYPVHVAVRGDGLHRPSLPLVARRPDAARAPRAAALVPRDLGINRALDGAPREPVRRVTVESWRAETRCAASASWSRSTGSRAAASRASRDCRAR